MKNKKQSLKDAILYLQYALDELDISKDKELTDKILALRDELMEELRINS